jgi:hypothetical protein
VEAKNGRIVRIRPLHYDEKYTAEEIGQWQVEARGKVFQSLLKTIPNPPAIRIRNGSILLTASSILEESRLGRMAREIPESRQEQV